MGFNLIKVDDSNSKYFDKYKKENNDGNKKMDGHSYFLSMLS